MNKDLGYSCDELIAVVLSRELKDYEIGHIGVRGSIPIAAVLLAQKLHAPNISLLAGGWLNPKPPALYPTFNDRSCVGVEDLVSVWELFSLHERGVDFMFYSGIQIDKYGNFNLTFVGNNIRQPRFRGSGVPNADFSVTAKRFFLYHAAHTKRVFVDRVDFITGAGNIDGADGRKRAGITTQGPALCVTPKAVMDFDGQTGRMRLKSVHEGITVDDVVQNTGFELIMPEQVPITPPPTEEELEVLRNEIDTKGQLRQ
ncbi:CoA-transferase subunit beta [Chloroflexota bacterium]